MNSEPSPLIEMSQSPPIRPYRPRITSLEQGLRRAAEIITSPESRAKIESAIQHNLMITLEVTIKHRPQDGIHVGISQRTFQQKKIVSFGGLEGPSPVQRENPQQGGDAR